MALNYFAARLVHYHMFEPSKKSCNCKIVFDVGCTISGWWGGGQESEKPWQRGSIPA